MPGKPSDPTGARQQAERYYAAGETFKAQAIMNALVDRSANPEIGDLLTLARLALELREHEQAAPGCCTARGRASRDSSNRE